MRKSIPSTAKLTSTADVRSQQSVVLGCLFTQLQRLRRDEDPVKVRLCRAHFGVLCSMPYNPAVHMPSERYTEPFTGQELARDQILWLIYKVRTLLMITDPHEAT
jgi:hypothetical protein